MFPYRDDNPTFSPPVVTVAIIAANLAIWILVQGMGQDEQLATTVCQFGLIPGDLLHRLPVGSWFELGRGMRCVIEGGPTWYTVFTSMFLHSGWLHVLGNMWFLWLFGNNVEDIMGHSRFLVFYLLCGVAAATAQVLAAPDSGVPMVGASGAIGGVLGAYIVLFPRVRVHTIFFIVIFATQIELPAWGMLGYWFALQLFGTRADQMSGGVAVWAHIGGFVTGSLLIFLFRSRALWARREAGLRAGMWRVAS